MITRLQNYNYLEEKIVWTQKEDPNYPYAARSDGDKLVIRLNDFPDENLYTLIVNKKEVASFDDWPKQWTRSKERNSPF